MDRRLSVEHFDAKDAESRAASICRTFGAGSTEYASFLEEVNGTLLGSMLNLPKFVPGDVKNGGPKSRKKKKHSKRSSHLTDSRTPPATPPLERVVEEETWVLPKDRGARSVQKCLTELPRRRSSPDVRSLRRSQTFVDAAEQVTMDEQVALQLQTLVREKAELIKENSRLKNENEGLKTLLEYATCEATADDDGEDSDYEMPTKEVLRHPGIQAWHPPELQSPTSYSSYGMLGSTSSGTEEKDLNVASQVSEEALSFRA